MKYNIYNQSGTVKAVFDADSSCTHDHKVQTDNVLNLTFTLTNNIGLEVNDYILIGAERFTLMEPYQPEQKSTVEYTYNVKFYGAENIASKAIFVDTEYRPITQYYDTPAAQLAYIVACINRVVGSNVYSVGAVVSSAAIQVSYQEGCTCLEALTTLSAAVGTEWWLDVTSFNLTKCEYGTPVELGYNQGLLNLTKEVNSSDDFYTRLIPQGSTKNIVPATYGHQTLQLPGGAKYVDFNADLYGIKEHYEAAAFADIFPRFTGTVGTVRTVQQTIEGVERTIYFFTSPGIPFNPNDYTISGTQKHLVFKSGDLLSQDFEANWYPETGEWELILQYPDENTQLPGGNLIPRAGDTYTVYNLNMPAEYYPLAEAELKAAVDALLADHAVDYAVYKAPTDHVYLEQNNITLTIGRRVKLLSDLYFPTGYRDSRITRVVRKLSDLNDMDIEISNQLIKSGYSQLKEDVSGLQTTLSERLSTEIINIVKSYQAADLTDDNVLSSLRVLREIAKHAISREVADTAQGLITFLQGLKSLGNIEVGDFVSGMLTGKGGRIDAQGNAEFQSAVIRGSMKVMELLINRLYAIESDYVYTEADTVEEVEEVGEQTYRLTLRRKYDGYFTAQKENNVLFGVINSLANGSGGEYYTAWSRVLSVNTTDNTITVVMYPDNEVPDGVNYPPAKGMVLARKGSSDSPLDGSHNERQDFWSMSSSDGRLLFLQNVAKPILEEYYYTLSIGKLPELEKFKALPIGKDDTAVYAKNIVAENYYQIDASGNVQTQEVYRGTWSADVAASDQPYRRIVNDVTTPTGSTSHILAVHTVYHRGCKWACLTDMTTLEPKWNSSAWQFLEGDSNYSIRFSAYPSERVRINAVNMVITARVYYGNLDVTEELLALPGTDIQWTRNSGIIPEDNAWHPALGATKNILNITNQDMATNWLTVQRVGFVITVFIPTGDGTYYQATDELPLTI